MKRRGTPTTTGRSGYVPRCAKFWLALSLVLSACLNPWPDDFPSNERGAVTVVGPDAPAFGGGNVGSDPGGYWSDEDRSPDFEDGIPPSEGSSPGSSPINESPDAGAPPADAGLRTGIRRLRSLRDGGADAQ